MEFLKIQSGSDHSIPNSDDTVIFSSLSSETIRIKANRPSFKYVISGSETYYNQSQKFVLRPGDFMFVSQGQELVVQTRKNAQTDGFCFYLDEAEFTELSLPLLKVALPDHIRCRATEVSGKAANQCLQTAEISDFLSEFKQLGRRLTTRLSRLGHRLDQQRVSTRTDNLYRLELARSHLRRNVKTGLDLDELSSTVGLSKFHLCRMFADVYGLAPMKYHARERVKSAAEKLAEERSSVFETAVEFGFSDASSFSKAFKKYFGVTPGSYKKARMDMVQN